VGGGVAVFPVLIPKALFSFTGEEVD